ncbi:type II toxin-antitoxin system RelE/ParE family toxin [Wolbachia endosymbiont of Cantharis cryptica]|uniref:type II toxin-antitoxin system RelE family toxin n=1 Tax=Wolbachia endosymbiont of Cantharis cryptica TaxID=3066132 RepID=UPI00376EB683
MKPKLYKIRSLKNVNEQDLPSLPKKIRSAVIDIIDDQLTVDPTNSGEPLRRSLKGHRRVAVDDYRIVYRVNTVKYEVIIITIGHRDIIYKKARKILHRH